MEEGDDDEDSIYDMHQIQSAAKPEATQNNDNIDEELNLA